MRLKALWQEQTGKHWSSGAEHVQPAMPEPGTPFTGPGGLVVGRPDLGHPLDTEASGRVRVPGSTSLVSLVPTASWSRASPASSHVPLSALSLVGPAITLYALPCPVPSVGLLGHMWPQGVQGRD